MCFKKESFYGVAPPARLSNLERQNGDKNRLTGKCAGLRAFGSRAAEAGPSLVRRATGFWLKCAITWPPSWVCPQGHCQAGFWNGHCDGDGVGPKEKAARIFGGFFVFRPSQIVVILIRAITDKMQSWKPPLFVGSYK